MEFEFENEQLWLAIIVYCQILTAVDQDNLSGLARTSTNEA